MISEDDQRRLDEAERECDHEIERLGTQFERSAKLLVVLGICLGFYHRNLGLIAVLIVGILPLLAGMIVVFCMIGVAVRKYLRLCNEILGPDDGGDDDPNGGKEIPKETPQSTSDTGAKVIPFPKTEKLAA